jgi:hypothetical protein
MPVLALIINRVEENTSIISRVNQPYKSKTDQKYVFQMLTIYMCESNSKLQTGHSRVSIS